MIAESFNESLALREMVAEKFAIVDKNTAIIEDVFHQKIGSLESVLDTKTRNLKLFNDGVIEKITS